MCGWVCLWVAGCGGCMDVCAARGAPIQEPVPCLPNATAAWSRARPSPPSPALPPAPAPQGKLIACIAVLVGETPRHAARSLHAARVAGHTCAAQLARINPACVPAICQSACVQHGRLGTSTCLAHSPASQSNHPAPGTRHGCRSAGKVAPPGSRTRSRRACGGTCTGVALPRRASGWRVATRITQW